MTEVLRGAGTLTRAGCPFHAVDGTACVLLSSHREGATTALQSHQAPDGTRWPHERCIEWLEYETLAERCAALTSDEVIGRWVQDDKARVGWNAMNLPMGVSAGCYVLVSEDEEAFQAHVRAHAYAQAMARVDNGEEDES